MNPNTAKFYDAYWGSDQCASYMRDKQLDAIAAYIVAQFGSPPLVIMDIGGGVSRIARLAKAAGHLPVVCDFSVEAVNRMHREGIDAMVFDVSRWRGKRLLQIVDVVTCTEVLEHLDRPDNAVRCAATHAKRAFFTVPNGCMGPETHPTHLRAYTAQALRDLLGLHFGNVRITTMYRWLVAECRA